MTTPRADPRVLVAVGAFGGLTGAATGVFWVAMSGRYDRVCDDGNQMCWLGVGFLGLIVFFATVAGSSLVTWFAVSMTRMGPKAPIVLTASLAPLALAVVYNVTGTLGGYRIALLAAVSAVLHIGVARAARIGADQPPAAPVI
ncbi:hypothetical protein AB0M83_43135 [Amycolatopsis sp. NPDC051106]|uniref:hypothetical protein n=1 Tax=unclassified Amycolatopsis TaxID=2618356 RepID=UPI003433EE16